MNNYYFFLIFLTISCNFHPYFAHDIFVYSDHYKQGTKEVVSISQCSNLPDGMVSAVTSIDTRDKCARFYDEKNCAGASIEVLPHSPSHNNLHSWGFNDRAVSVGPCRDPCDLAVTGNIPEEPLEIQVFSRPNFKGTYQNIRIEGCTLIPTSLIHRTLSVKTHANCLQLYNTINCDLKGNNVKSIELRDGTPSHDDISSWWFPEARAITHCSYKCNSSISSKMIKQQVLPTEGEVVLFDGKNFEGNWHRINIKGKRCFNVTQEWEGVAFSVKVGDKTCVLLYDRKGCSGGSHHLPSSESDLSQRNFDGVTRSMAPCHVGSVMDDMSRDIRPRGINAKLNTTHHHERNHNSNNNYSLSPIILTVVIVVPILGVIISAFLVLFIVRRCNPYKNIMEMLSEKEIQEFLSGLGMDIEKGSGGTGNTGVDNGDDYSVELLAQNKPYNDAYEIPRFRIKYDTKVPLGMGEFGVVYKGMVSLNEENKDASAGSGKKIPVAIKTTRPSTGAQYLRSLLKEVKVMLYVGKHPHIAQMVGCCTENLRKGEILVLMEYCSKGSLESFLQKNRQYFKNIVKKGRIERQDQSSSLGYTNLANVDPQKAFDLFQLLQWCIEIARGMEFLANSKVIHSDLAARNILLDEKLQAKISDFGLSRQLYCYTQYVKKHQEPLPWRWLAPESLKNLEFSSKSDVWSYGVLCWEILTLGEKPYPGVVWNDGFISNLEDGLRLGKPKYATTECYNLMIRCWEDDPLNRPTFSQITEDLQEITDSHDVNGESAYSNI